MDSDQPHTVGNGSMRLPSEHGGFPEGFLEEALYEWGFPGFESRLKGVGGHELRMALFWLDRASPCAGGAADGVIRGSGPSCSVTTIRTTVRAGWGGVGQWGTA